MRTFRDCAVCTFPVALRVIHYRGGKETNLVWEGRAKDQYTMSGFNFGGTGGTGGGFSFGTPKTTANTATGGFSFAPTGAGGIGFGTPAQNATTSQPTSLFSMSTPAAATPGSGFSFGTPATTTPAATGGGFSFGANTPKLNLGGLGTTQPSGGLGGFGLPNNSAQSTMQASQPTATTGFSFGTSAAVPQPATQPAAQPAATGGFSFSNAISGTSTGFGLNATSSAPNAAPQTTAATGLSFGIPNPASTGVATSQPAATFSLGGQSTGFGIQPSTAAPAAAAPSGALPAYPGLGTNLTFGAKPSAPSTNPAASTAAPTTALSSLLASSGPSLFASIASSTAPPTATVGPSTTATGLSLGGASTGIATTGIGFGFKPQGATTSASATTNATSTSSTPSTCFQLGLKPLTSLGTSLSTSSSIGSVTATTTLSSTASTTPMMTYAHLETLINKWSLELEDQEKHFLHQATQVNAWDRTLIENGEKITTLHREVEKVKLDQKRLDQELDFILSQQKELEDLLNPLEESVKEQSGTIYLQHADEEREKTYKLAENIDAQLKRMAQDLKDIIEHLNTSGGPADTSDPLQQICKILNAHMDSLQWIDQNSGESCEKDIFEETEKPTAVLDNDVLGKSQTSCSQEKTADEMVLQQQKPVDYDTTTIEPEGRYKAFLGFTGAKRNTLANLTPPQGIVTPMVVEINEHKQSAKKRVCECSSVAPVDAVSSPEVGPTISVAKICTQPLDSRKHNTATAQIEVQAATITAMKDPTPMLELSARQCTTFEKIAEAYQKECQARATYRQTRSAEHTSLLQQLAMLTALFAVGSKLEIILDPKNQAKENLAKKTPESLLERKLPSHTQKRTLPPTNAVDEEATSSFNSPYIGESSSSDTSKVTLARKGRKRQLGLSPGKTGHK